MDERGDRVQLLPNEVPISGFRLANIHHGVYFRSAVFQTPLRFREFRHGGRGAQRERRNRTYGYVVAAEFFGSQRDMAGIDAYRGETEFRSLRAEAFDVRRRDVRLKSGVVYECG